MVHSEGEGDKNGVCDEGHAQPGSNGKYSENGKYWLDSSISLCS